MNKQSINAMTNNTIRKENLFTLRTNILLLHLESVRSKHPLGNFTYSFFTAGAEIIYN